MVITLGQTQFSVLSFQHCCDLNHINVIRTSTNGQSYKLLKFERSCCNTAEKKEKHTRRYDIHTGNKHAKLAEHHYVHYLHVHSEQI